MFVIYAIESTVSDLVYVGLTHKYDVRMKAHISCLSRGKHGNAILQKEVDDFGLGCLIPRILEECTKDNAKHREQFWINKMAKVKFIANLRPSDGVAPAYGRVWTEEQKANHSLALQGHPGRKMTREESLRINAFHKPSSPEKLAKRRADAYKHLAEKTRKEVVNLDTGEVFYSGAEAAKALGVCASSIYDTCNGRMKQVRGFRFAWRIKH